VDWIDFLLNVSLLALVPFLLAAYGGHLAAETISDLKARRRAKTWFWLLCVIGVGIAALSQYRYGQAEDVRNKVARQQDLMATEAAKEAKEARAELAASENANTKKLLDLQSKMTNLLMRPQPVQQKIDELKLRDEIAAAVANKVKPGIVAPAFPQTQTAVPAQPKVHSCRGDALQECTDEELMEWGSPLVSQIEVLDNQYNDEVKKLDDLKNGNWIALVFGAPDKSTKWLKGFEQARFKATERFRDCCAESVLAYHRELMQRVGGGEQEKDLYDWVEDVTKPIQSKEYKRAKQDPRAPFVKIDLDRLQSRLRIKDIYERRR
jgi:hypothetical protein